MRTGWDRAPVSTTSRPLISGPPGLSVSFVTKDKRRSQASSWGVGGGGWGREAGGGREPEDEASFWTRRQKDRLFVLGLQRHKDPLDKKLASLRNTTNAIFFFSFFFFFFLSSLPFTPRLLPSLFYFLCVVFLSAQSPTSLALLLTASLLLPFHPFSSSSSSTPCPPSSRAIRQTAGPRAASALSDRPKKR